MAEFYLKKIIEKEQLAFIQNLFKKEDLSMKDFWHKKEKGALKVTDEEVKKLYDFLTDYLATKAKGKKMNVTKAIADIEKFFKASDKTYYTYY